MCKSVLACILIIAGILTCVVCVIGLAIPLWVTGDSGPISTSVTVKVTSYEGLWQRCTITEFDADTRSCDKLWDIAGQHTHAKRAVLAMCFIGMILMIVFVVAMALHISICDTFDLLPKVAGILAIVAGLLILIGIIVYATKVKDDMGFKASALNAGFGLCLTSSIAAFVIGGLSFFVD